MRCQAIAVNVTNPVAARAAVDVAVDRVGGLDVLVNNAGYGNVNAIEDTDLDEFRRQIETNLFGTIILTKAAIPVMRAQGAGHIIHPAIFCRWTCRGSGARTLLDRQMGRRRILRGYAVLGSLKPFHKRTKRISTRSSGRDGPQHEWGALARSADA